MSNIVPLDPSLIEVGNLNILLAYDLFRKHHLLYPIECTFPSPFGYSTYLHLENLCKSPTTTYWLVWLGLCCWNISQRGQNLIGLQMINKFMKCLIFMFKIPKDSKDFFHGCRHDLEYYEIWHQQEMCNPQPQLTKNGYFWKLFFWRKWVICIQLQKEFSS